MMESAFISTPIGVAKLEGDENGLQAITVLDTDEELTKVIPEVLEDGVYQLKEYFEGQRENFTLDLNPQDTYFQKRVWEA